MLPADSAAGQPLAPCRACGQPLPPDRAVCPSCGAAHGDANRCPHCSAVADVKADAALGFRCLVCGGPRLALDVAGVTLSAATRSALTGAAAEQTKHLMLTSAGALLTGMGALGLVVALVVVLAAAPGLAATLATLLACSVPLGAGLWVLQRAAAARKLRASALHRAQVSALGDVQVSTGVLDAARAAELLRIDPERAQLLLAEVSVASLLNEGPPPRLRVAPAPPPVASQAATSGAVESEAETTRHQHGNADD